MYKIKNIYIKFFKKGGAFLPRLKPWASGALYGEFWRSRKRYVVCKGSRASKKSTTAALKIIYNMMKYPLSNCLVIRKTAATLKDSCYSQLRWALNFPPINAYAFEAGDS